MIDEAKRIVETLRYCEGSGARCGDCPNGFNDKGIPNCHSQSAIADLIESLSAKLEQTENNLSELLYYVTGGRYSKADYSTDDMRRFVDDYTQCICNECYELEQVKRERDAAVEALRSLAFCGDCEHYAKSTKEEPCKTCMDDPYCSKPYWQWRGVREE